MGSLGYKALDLQALGYRRSLLLTHSFILLSGSKKASKDSLVEHFLKVFWLHLSASSLQPLTIACTMRSCRRIPLPVQAGWSCTLLFVLFVISTHGRPSPLGSPSRFLSSAEKIEAEMKGSPSNLVSIAKKPAPDVPPNQHSLLEHEGVRYPSPERKEYQEEFRRVYTPPLTADSERVQAYYEDLKKKMINSGAWGTPRIKHALGYAPELHTGFMHGRVHEVASKRILDEHSDIIKGGSSGLRRRALPQKLVDPRTALQPLKSPLLVKRELARILSLAKKPAKGIPESEHSLLGHAGRPPLTLKELETAHVRNHPSWGYHPPATKEDVDFSYGRMKNFMKQQGGWGTPSFHKNLDEFILGTGKWQDAGHQARERIIREHLSSIHAAGQMHPLSHMYPETNPPVKGVSAALRKSNEPLRRRSDRNVHVSDQALKLSESRRITAVDTIEM
ncbi:hypothetical protein IE81DRAFT_175999 [Ceraceosorus guamensis]|uniref:Uncharacterized protein n=1 Tax=Ceraceosorus guamensis TaxID=1522189 RepID=A0A316VVB6_9BASI|nr:hypothetical protein IE81DRAFT_175999 [Ceraceosorus guamensis]PWN41420.1 hypothetical protein IE81DRAFT_175999 [Ceraceosorus guamensis]